MVKQTNTVLVGGVSLGGGEPIRIQSMTTTKTADVEKTVREADIGEELREVSQTLKKETDALQQDLDHAAAAVNDAMKKE